MSLIDVVVELANRGRKISDETLRRYEDGVTQPRADDLALLAAIFECSVTDFFEKEAA